MSQVRTEVRKVSEPDGGKPPIDDPSARTSPVPMVRTPVGWADRTRWPWYLLMLAVLLLILVSCQLNRTEDRTSGPAPTVTVTVTAPAPAPAPTPRSTTAATSERPSDGDYRRPARPGDDELFYRSTFTSCATLNIVYRHGVGTDGAVDQVVAGEVRVDDWSDDPSSYWVNEGLDVDADGIACERGDR